MKISAKSEYAILAMLELVETYDSESVRCLEEISQGRNIPRPFLVQILVELKLSGFVESRRGAEGGYRLARSPKEITVGDILRVVGGPLLPFRCSTNGHTKSDCNCPRHGSCVLTPMWDETRHAIESVVDRITLSDLSNRQTMMDPPMYYI